MKNHWFSGMVVLMCLVAAVRPLRHGLAPPGTEKLTALFPHVGFDVEFAEFYGGQNVRLVENGSAVNLVLDKLSGCGIRSKHMYYHGFFSAAIKLPPGFTAGVVLAFYGRRRQRRERDPAATSTKGSGFRSAAAADARRVGLSTAEFFAGGVDNNGASVNRQRMLEGEATMAGGGFSLAIGGGGREEGALVERRRMAMKRDGGISSLLRLNSSGGYLLQWLPVFSCVKEMTQRLEDCNCSLVA